MQLRVVLSLLLSALSCHCIAADPPTEFGTSWDNPRTAAPPIERPATKSCSVEIVNHGFSSFEPYKNSIEPPRDCPGPWAKIVLDLDGSVKGRQYDRLARIEIGGVVVLRSSTPEPSREGISWHVEKDLSRYASLFAHQQDVTMELGNVVNETYTGVFAIKAHVTFYQADAKHPAATTAADRVEAPQIESHEGPDYVASFSVPNSTERLIVETFATGSGGGCEEFWYLTAPKELKYSCPAEKGPYREIQLVIDGRVSGIALPYPNIWTGGWSNPFLWYVLPAPRTFDIRPAEFDITPLVGTLNDGKAHELRVHVLGVGEDSKGWSIQASLHQWLDASGNATRGRLREHKLSELKLSHPINAGKDGGASTATNAAHDLHLIGELETSHGKVVTSVDYRLSNRNEHRWDKDENHDHLTAGWSDRVVVSRDTGGKRAMPRQVREFRYAIDGEIFTQKVEDKERLTTQIRIDDVAEILPGDEASAEAMQTRDHFEGSAAYNQKVPREQRRATGRSSERYERHAHGSCYDKMIDQTNGIITAQTDGCSAH